MALIRVLLTQIHQQQWLVKVLLGFWLLIALLGIGSLSFTHLATLPAPSQTKTMLKQVNRLRKNSKPYFLVHIIYEKCSCTQRLFEHLIKRGEFKDAEEVILYIGLNKQKQALATKRNFAFVNLPEKEITEVYGLDVAPVLMVFNAKDQLDYIGGYFNHPSAIFAQDHVIYQHIHSGQKTTALPVFGCAVEKNLQKKVDPLGIVYR